MMNADWRLQTLPRPARRAGKINKWLIIGGVVVGLIVVVCAGVLISGEKDVAKGQAARKDALAAFGPEVAGYLAPAGLKDPADGKDIDPAAAGKFKGKVVCLDTAKKAVDDDYMVQVPEALRAMVPAEVGAVVWLDWGRREVGKYDDGAAGYVQTCRVTVVDKPTATVVARTTIDGDPQEKKKGSGDVTGLRPWPKVVKFLQERAAG